MLGLLTPGGEQKMDTAEAILLHLKEHLIIELIYLFLRDYACMDQERLHQFEEAFFVFVNECLSLCPGRVLDDMRLDLDILAARLT
jgi:hypothetical protein